MTERLCLDKHSYMQVCVPIDPENAENFDPMDGVPTVSQLLTDLDQSDVKQSTADMQVRLTW